MNKTTPVIAAQATETPMDAIPVAPTEAGAGAEPPESIAETKGRRHRPKKEKKHLLKHKDVNDGAPSFADGINIYKLLWVFIVCSFLGVLIETLFVWTTTGELMRRSGMLYGPFNQIYGFGGVLFTLCLYRFRNRSALLIFCVAGLLGMAFEFLCSLLQEMMFGSTSWDYSQMPTSIGGRTNILYGVFWGILGLVFMDHIWPFLDELIERIPNTVGKTATIVVSVALALDLALSGLAVARTGDRAQGVPPTTSVGRWLDDTYPDAVMTAKYPSMQFTHAPANAATTSATETGAPAAEAGNTAA